MKSKIHAILKETRKPHIEANEKIIELLEHLSLNQKLDIIEQISKSCPMSAD